MRKPMILMLTAMAAFVAVLGLVKIRQIQVATAQAASFQPPPEAVTTILAREEQWPAVLSAVGSVAAVHGVTVSADLPGIVSTISFDSGKTVEAGQTLVVLDTRQEQAQLAAAVAQRDLARLNLTRARGLAAEGIVSQSDFDRAAAESDQAEAKVGEIKASIERKTIRAPFTGVLGIRQVNLGQYLAAGDPIVPLQAIDPIYVNFAVPQQRVAVVHVGGEVRVSVEGIGPDDFVGKVTAIDSVVDEATRNIQIQATLANHGGRLHPGMFVKAHLAVGAGEPAIGLPASAINHAPYGDSVFIVGDVQRPAGQAYKGVRQQFVTIGAGRGDQVAVITGVKSGEEVVTSGVFKLRPNAAVHVDNTTRPGNDPAPKPEDN